ncbi:Reverse transcriptase (RNA-dependent DNA polymerase) [Phytophthora infestans]|uniref:Reverse transcriptase (RNA-dependent DNA polymerase) n=1 Tax=Phytophthora infestans TaxID=4787 RepID=A0A833W436_PHYIN|nr:Reverse transcriptase (RNA-dependent DNA polymerase) [Phytophthora infestans]
MADANAVRATQMGILKVSVFKSRWCGTYYQKRRVHRKVQDHLQNRLCCERESGVYTIFGPQNDVGASCLRMARGNTLMGWHRRLGHASTKPFKKMARKKSADDLANPAELLDELTNNADRDEPATDSNNDEPALQEASSGGMGTSTGQGNLSDAAVRANLRADADYGFLAVCDVLRGPPYIGEARRSKNSPKWEQAMFKEIESRKASHTRELVKLPADERAIENAVQFRVKQSELADVICKARVCARGDTQPIHYAFFDVHVRVASLPAVRIFLVFTVRWRLQLLQADVQSEYVKAGLREKIYIRQVKGFKCPSKEQHVYLLRKVLYGLRQAGAEWHREIDATLQSLDLRPTRADRCLYFTSAKRLFSAPLRG